jgi:chromate reductase, NAD(P)H dehydrogenase (quinone)
MVKILAFSGSARTGSYNQKLVKIAAQGAEQADADVKIVNLADYPMPLFNQDLEAEQGMPANSRAFKELLISHDGFLIASPEYNSAFSPLLKNAIDWVSRREGDEPPLLAYRNKTAVIMAASPGALGGLRGLVMLRMLLSNIGMVVLPGQLALANADKAFDDEGNLLEQAKQAAALELGANLKGFLDKFQ